MSKHLTKNAFVLFLLFLLLFSLFVPVANAENAGENISGSSESVSCFLVTTDADAKKPFLKIQQTTGQMGRTPKGFAGHFYTRKHRMYERYYVKVEELDGDRVKSTKEYQTERKNYTLNLSPGAVYRVTMTPLYITWEKKMQDKSYALVNGGNNPYLVQLDFFDLDEENSFLDTVSMDIIRSNWLPTGWIKHATWRIVETEGVKSVTVSDLPAETPPVSEQTPQTAPQVPSEPDPTPAKEDPSVPVPGSVSYDPDLAISQAASILDTIPQTGARGAGYVSRVLRAGGLESVQEKGAGDLMDYLNDSKNWGRLIGSVIRDPRYSQLKKGDVLACVCAKGGSAADYTNGHGKGKGLYYGIQNFIVSEVGSDYVKVYSATTHRYDQELRLSSDQGDFILPCNKCGDSSHVHWIAFSFAEDILIKSASPNGVLTAEGDGWQAFPEDDVWGDWNWYYVRNGKNLTGWQVIDGRTCYFQPDGRLSSGITYIDGVPYYFMEMPLGYGPGDGTVPDFGFLCRGGFYSLSDGSVVFTDDNGVALAWDGSLSPDGGNYFEYAFKAYDIASATPDIISCTFYDLDGDGVKEFITLSGSVLAEQVYTFYRVDYTRGEYIRIGAEPGYEHSLVRDPKTGHLLIELVHTSWQYVYEITYDGKTVHSREIAAIDSEDGGYRSFGDSVYEYPFNGGQSYSPAPDVSVPSSPDSGVSASGTVCSLDTYMNDMGFQPGKRYESELGTHTVSMWGTCYFNLPGGKQYAGDIMVGGIRRANALAVFLDNAFDGKKNVTINGTSYPLGSGTIEWINPGYDRFRFSFGALSAPDQYYGPPATHGYYRLTVQGDGKDLTATGWLDYSAIETCSVSVKGCSRIRIVIEMVTGTQRINGSKHTLNLGFFDMAFTSEQEASETLPGQTAGQSSPTTVPAPVNVSAPISEECDFFSVTLPASWKDRYIISVPDVGVAQFFNKANYEAGNSGLLFSVYATTRVRTHMQLLDFSIDRRFPQKNDSPEVGCAYLCAWEKGLVFALYDGFASYNTKDPVLAADYLEMYREISTVLKTFRLKEETLNGMGDYIEYVEESNPDWPFYGKNLEESLF